MKFVCQSGIGFRLSENRFPQSRNAVFQKLPFIVPSSKRHESLCNTYPYVVINHTMLDADTSINFEGV